MDKIQILNQLKELLKDSFGRFALVIGIMGFFMYKQQETIDELQAVNKELDAKVRTAYSEGQNDAIQKVGEQIKVIQSMGIIIDRSIEQQKQNNDESKKINRQLDKLKNNLQ